MKAYWWKGKPNFGDALTGTLLERLGIEHSWASAWEADFVACGSVLTHLPKGWSGTVWGTGKARKNDKPDLTNANVIALRGVLSAQGIPGTYALGDPGLLANLLAEPTEEISLGVVPHWEDRHLARAWKQGEVVDVTQDPLTVIRHIARCKRIVSSSLHGIIVADALGIQRRWETFPKLQGHGFKMRDYATVVGAFEPQIWQTAEAARVRSARRGLTAALDGYRQSLVGSA